VTHLTQSHAESGNLEGVSFVPIIFSVVMFVGVVYGFFTVSGSGIAERPYRRIYGNSRGAWGPGSASGRDNRVSIDNWSRGTR
jgi:hypothetical protein